MRWGTAFQAILDIQNSKNVSSGPPTMVRAAPFHSCAQEIDVSVCPKEFWEQHWQ